MGYPRECPCGSGEFPDLETDARGIYIGYMCSKCKKERLSGYRTEVLTDPGYECDEDIEPDGGGFGVYDPFDNY